MKTDVYVAQLNAHTALLNSATERRRFAYERHGDAQVWDAEVARREAAIIKYLDDQPVDPEIMAHSLLLELQQTRQRESNLQDRVKLLEKSISTLMAKPENQL